MSFKILLPQVARQFAEKNSTQDDWSYYWRAKASLQAQRKKPMPPRIRRKLQSIVFHYQKKMKEAGR